MRRITTCVLIIIASAAAPWLLGGYSSWCFLLAPFTVLVAALFWLPQQSQFPTSRSSCLAILAAALLTGFVWLQATPLPQSILTLLTSADRISRLNSLSTNDSNCESVRQGETAAKNGWAYISSEPSETRRQWVILATALGICLISMSLANDEFCRLLIIFSLAVNGAIFSLFAIVQRASAPKEIYWTIKTQWANLPFGAFVNRNHAALFLALSALCALFCICLLLSRKFTKDVEYDNDSPNQDRSLSLTELRMIWLSQKEGVLLPLVFCALFCAVSSIVAASRSGSLAFGAVVVVSGVMLYLSGADRRLIAVIGVLGGVAAIVSGAKLEYMMERFGGDAIEAGFSGRYAHWVDVLDQYPEYSLTGVGFGNYAYATLPYLSKPSSFWFQHADNQYVEAFVELGLAGSLLIFGFVGLLAAHCIRLLFNNESQSKIVGLLGLGLIGIGAINAMSDFGLVMAGVLLPMSLALGLVLGYHPPSQGRPKSTPWGTTAGLATKTISIAVLLVATSLGLAHFANSEDDSAANQNAIQWLARKVSKHLREPSQTATWKDAQSDIDAYQSNVKKEMNLLDPGLFEDETNSLENLALLKRALVGDDESPDFQGIRTALDSHDTLKAARQKHLRLIESSPLRFQSHLALARIDLHLCPGPNVTTWVSRVRQIHPTSGVDASKAGIVSVINGDFEAGGNMLAQALREAPGLDRKIYSVLRSQMTVQELKSYVIKDDAALLIRAADHYYGATKDWSARSYLYSQLRQSIETGKATSVTHAEARFYLAKAKYMTGDRASAYLDFEAACREEPHSAQWLRELAKLYQKDGKVREALRVLKTLGQEFGYDENLLQQINALERRKTTPKR